MDAPKPDIPDLDELMRRIHLEVEARRAGAPAPVAASGAPMRATILPVAAPAPAPLRWQHGGPAFKPADSYALADLLALHDEDFVDAAYRVALNRAPDAAGRAHYLHMLRAGALAKPEILGRLRYSPEGRARGTKIRGLLSAFVLNHLRRIPVLGYPFGVLAGVANLPVLFRNVRAVEAHGILQQRELGRVLNAAIAREADLASRFESIARAQREGADRLDVLHRDATERRDEHRTVARQVELLRGSVAWRADFELMAQREEAARNQLARLEQRATALDAAAREATVRLDAATRDATARFEAAELALSERASTAQLEAVSASVAAQQAGLQALAATASAQRDALKVELQVELQAHRAELDAARAGVEAQRAAIEAARAEIDAVRAAIDTRAASSAVAALDDRLGAALDDGERLRDALAAESARLEAALATKMDLEPVRMLAARVDVKADGADLVHRTEKLSTALATVVRSVRELERKHAALVRAPRARSAPAEAARMDVERAHIDDEFYATFEDTFRGSREEIARRVSGYLDEVRASGAGGADAPVLDLGAGRGEWLELLKTAGLHAHGVDTNRVLVAEGVERGLAMELVDAVSGLRKLPDASQGAITAMHVVEHVELGELLALLDEAFRVLRPGGILVLETPNPENLLVATRYFYYDPTHRNPLPPPLLRYLVEARGFERARVDGLTADRGSTALEPVPDDVPGAAQINAFVDLVSQPPDYAVIAYRP